MALFTIRLSTIPKSLCGCLIAIPIAWGVVGCPAKAEAARGQLELRAIDAESEEPTAVRMILRNSKARPVFAAKAPRVGDGFLFDGEVVLELSPGTYTFTLDKGPEFREHTGRFVIQSGAADNHQVEMRRFVTMKDEGWWSGDLHVERPVREMPLRMLANDLHFANVITWRNGTSDWQRQRPPRETNIWVGNERAFNLMGGRDRRFASEMILGRLPEPLTLAADEGEYPSPFETAQAATALTGHLHLSRLDARDLPVWIASRKLGSVGLLHSGLLESGSRNESYVKQPDEVLFPPPLGVGRWSQQIYFRMLNLGVRVPPAAGSGAGLNENPVGYNRVYVYSDGPFQLESWWEGLRAGRVVLTNGPLLRPRVNGELPGHVFRPEGDELQLEVEALLSTREKIDYLEVIQNGQSVIQTRLEDWAASGGRLPPVIFQEDGWLMVRVVTRHSKTYRCACSGPFFVSFANSKPKQRDAKMAQFFLDWLYQRAREIKLSPDQQKSVMRYHRAARDFWQPKVDGLNEQRQAVSSPEDD